ncbi:hypothetical protein D299_gp067 [Escherichia phage HX01]|nr:hypothetical protein D299_gp067 [Escherichia phage HX01]
MNCPFLYLPITALGLDLITGWRESLIES